MARLRQTQNSQALNFGVQSVTSARAPQEAGAFTATGAGPPPTATTNSARTAVLNDLTGQIVVSSAVASGTAYAASNIVYATILSNTASTNTVLTVDGWWKIADGTAGTAASSTAYYFVLPAQAPFWVMGLTTNVSSIAGTETGTAPGGTEYSASGLARTIVTTLTHTAGADTGTIGNTFTFTGAASNTIGESFIANSTVASGTSGRGNFAFFADQLNGATGYVVASSGDTLQITYTITYATVP